MAVPFLPSLQPLVDLATAYATEAWRKFFEDLMGLVTSVNTAITSFPGFSSGTLAGQPVSLGLADAGRLYALTDYGHEMRWDGTKWLFAPGDCGNGFFVDRATVPVESSFWQKCDGTATTYIVTGGITITTAVFTTPDLTGGVYRKGGAYTGVVLSAIAPGAATSVSGNSDDEAAHTHVVPAQTVLSDVNDFSILADVATAIFAVASNPHHHNVTMPAQPTGAGSAHHHGLGSAAAATTVDATAEPVHLAATVYFRR